MLVEEFLLGEDKLEHGTEFFNHSENSCKEGHIKTTGSFFFLLSGQVLQFRCEKDCFLQVKETVQVSYMTWRERMNFYAWIHMSNFHPIKLK